MLMAFVDTLIDVDLSDLPATEAEAVAWVKEVEDPRRFGVADVDETGWVERIVEKPSDMSNNLAVVGFYYFQRAEDLIGAIERQLEAGDQLKGEWYLADAINLMLADGLKMQVETVDIWEDCGKPGPLLDTNRYLLDHGRDNSPAAERDSATIVAPVFIDPTAEVTASTVGPHVSVGANCVIEGSELRNSIVEAGCQIRRSTLHDSVVGRDALIVGAHGRFNLGDNSEVEGSQRGDNG